MSLDSENRKAIVDYRTEKAVLALEDADFLADAGKFNLAANRLYCAGGTGVLCARNLNK